MTDQMHRWPVVLLAGLVVLLGGVTAQEMAGGGAIAVAESEQYGEYLTDSEGNALYTFIDMEVAPSLEETYTEGIRDTVAECTGGCLDAWPPFTADGEITAAEGTGIQGDLLYTAMVGDHNQVVYNGYPLYTFANDASPGDTNGQAVEGNGGTWFLIAPDGTPVDYGEMTQEAG